MEVTPLTKLPFLLCFVDLSQNGRRYRNKCYSFGQLLEKLTNCNTNSKCKNSDQQLIYKDELLMENDQLKTARPILLLGVQIIAQDNVLVT